MDADSRGRLLATEADAHGSRAVRFGPDGGREAFAGGDPGRALAVLDGGDWLALARPATAAEPERIVLASGTGIAVPLPGPGGERYVGRSADGRKLWTARPNPDGGESLIETVPPSTLGRSVLDAPAGFRIAAISGDGLQVALVRTVAPGADEVVWSDRTSGERRLVLPSGPDGRFRPQLFADSGRRLLIVADDASELPRLEWLDLDSGRRELPLETPCVAIGARRLGSSILADVACDGRRRTVPIEGDAPWAGHLPPGSLAVSAVPAADGTWWLTLAGPRSARDLALLPPDRLMRPLTWGLEPRLDPAALVAPESFRLASAGLELPAELWRPVDRPAAAVVWLEADDRPPSWGEFHPLFAFLASRGIAVLRFRARGSDGFGHALRSAGTDAPIAAALADARAAGAHLAALANGAPLPVAVVGEGARGAVCDGEDARDGAFVACLAIPARPGAVEFRSVWARLREHFRTVD